MAENDDPGIEENKKMANNNDDENIQELEQFLKEIKHRFEQKLELRKRNLNANNNRPDETFFRKLDSNLKKNTTFVKKVKSFTENQKDSIIRDFGGLNLSKYIAELANSVAEAKLKISDVPAMVELCSLAHQRYAEFSSNLLDFYFKKTFPKRKDDQITNLSKFRVDLRLLADLITVGVFVDKDSLPVLGGALNYLVQSDKEDHANLPLVITFCKYCGEDYANLVPKQIRQLADKFSIEIPQLNIFTPDRQKNVINLLNEYYSTLSKDAIQAHKDLRKCERQIQRQYDTKGEIHPEAQQRCDEAKSAFDKLYANLCSFADILNQEAPDLPHEKSEDADGLESKPSGSMIVEGGIGFHNIEGGGLWEDVDTQTFYESLPELRAMLPGILFKDSEQPTLPPVEEKIADEEEETEPKEETEPPSTAVAVVEETEDIEKSNAHVENEIDDEGEADLVGGSLLKKMMEAFIAQLPNTINRDLIDRAAIDFVTNLNTKPNRKKLVKALFNVHRNRLDLLPFYARLVAVLQPVMPDVGTELVQMLIHDFRRQMRKKDQLFIETKVKILRFIGELVKFKIFPKSEALHCLKMLLFDFRHHHIDMACALLDDCGYFLFHSPDSHQKTKILLEQMMRKRQTTFNMDQRYQLMIDNAFYTCNPPTASATPKKERSPMQEYIRRLLYKELGKNSVEKVLKQMRKLNWDDPQVDSYVVRCLSQPWRIKFNNVQWLASLLAGLMYYYDHIGYDVVDNILEELRLGMEVNHHKLNQRRLCCLKYLGELYNYRVVDSAIIFNVLYSLITFGVSYDPKIPSLLDPPEHLFRIRLSCVCLDTCGEYFDRGSSKKKLDCYLAYLQRYYWMKRSHPCFNENERPFPIEVENVFFDTIEYLRPKMAFFNNFEESEQGVKAIEEEYKEKIESALKFLQPKEGVEQQQQQYEEEDEDDDRHDPLRPIEEKDEDDEFTPSQDSGRGAERQPSESFHDPNVGDIGDFEPLMKDDSDLEEDVNVRLSNKANAAVDPEDENFMQEFDKMMSDSLLQRMQDQVKPPKADFSVPVNVKAKMRARFEPGDESEVNEVIQEEQTKTINFALMTRGKSNKPALKTLKVPVDSELAQSLKYRELSELEEKEKVKQLTLNINRRMQEEEMAADLETFCTRVGAQSVVDARRGQHAPQQQQQQNVQQSQSSKQFQHQKGAPNPHEIFSKTWWN